MVVGWLDVRFDIRLDVRLEYRIYLFALLLWFTLVVDDRWKYFLRFMIERHLGQLLFDMFISISHILLFLLNSLDSSFGILSVLRNIPI